MTPATEGISLSCDIPMVCVVEGYRSELSISLRAKEVETSPELWKRMGSEPFYSITMYDGFLNRHISAYVSKDHLEKGLGLR